MVDFVDSAAVLISKVLIRKARDDCVCKVTEERWRELIRIGSGVAVSRADQDFEDIAICYARPSRSTDCIAGGRLFMDSSVDWSRCCLGLT